MSKYLVFLCVVALVFVGISAVFAGGVDNRNNFSAEYIRTLNRAHATDAPDAAVYNPAGTVRLKNGFHVSVNNQYIMKSQSHSMEQNDSPNWTLSNYEFKDTKAVPFLPSAFLVYKQDQIAGFFAFTVPSGGGSVQYSELSYTPYTYLLGLLAIHNKVAKAALPNHVGSSFKNDSPTTDAKIESIGYGFTLGGAFDVVKDMVSVAAGGRVIMQRTTKEVVGSGTITSYYNLGANSEDYNYDIDVKWREDGNGFGGFLGVNISPMKELNIAIKYDTVVRIKNKYIIKEDETIAGVNNATGALSGVGTATKSNFVNGAILANSDKYKNRDLPPMISLGVSYKVMDDLLVAVSYNAYLNNEAMWNNGWSTSTHTSDQRMDQRWYNTSQEGGLCVEYNITKELKVSAGYLYTQMGTYKYWYKEAESIEFPYSNAFALGFAFDAGSGLMVNFGLQKTYYPEFKTSKYLGDNFATYTRDSATGVASGLQSMTFKKDTLILALGVNYSI